MFNLLILAAIAIISLKLVGKFTFGMIKGFIIIAGCYFLFTFLFNGGMDQLVSQLMHIINHGITDFMSLLLRM